ncbi:LysR family transcriptional regulator [Amycolatopsis sp. YIM 10]|uniref:LysR family transcriptional regulator n=1 Tax=Amycolatopsis sp. YIM 10 TaxID=2653857 RepID=UPI0012AAA504|nr:LysR family transcriptional regulator [Amycolatopsis sp. YIM 10]QFU85340.1 Bacterial regulatory helix-turn-helix protein, lysR family [Amycolatopsis sp. YIM 10]
MNRLLQSPQSLLDTTMDQLRTLIAVRDTGTALGAARALGRAQSSIQKQLDTLNRNFGELCGEPLVVKQGRGQDVLFTETGKAMVERARRTLADWLDEIDEGRRRTGETLTVGTTRFTLGFVTSVSEKIAGELSRLGVELRFLHLRTKDLLPALADKRADVVCGSVVTAGGEEFAECEVLEWRRSGLSVITNLPESQLPGQVLRAKELHTLPLVVSATGLIAEILRGWFGSGYRDKLDVAAEIDTLNYGFELLHSGLVRGCMLVTRGIGEAATDGRIPEGGGLRVIPVVNDVDPRLEVLVGAFARRGEQSPAVKLLWDALLLQHSEWRE